MDVQPTVTTTLEAGSPVRSQARHHAWSADEPESLGGQDQGPSPYELLLGSLSACTALTLRIYAEHKGFSLESVDVESTFARERGSDCAECDDDSDALHAVIRTRVVIRGELDDAQRQRLTEVASRCPVHRTLEGGPVMVETVVFEPARARA